MKIYARDLIIFLSLMTLFSLNATEKALPEKMLQLMNQPQYEHAIWGLYVQDLETGEVLFDKNFEKFFSPASTTKLFSVSALLHTLGDDYRFKTPVFASGKIEDGRLLGNLILVAQGDLTMGGRESVKDKISFTKMDHIIANEVPGAILTEEDPLHGLNELAMQIYKKGIRKIEGDVIIDDSLFEITKKREMILSPIMINENLIDIVVNPTVIGQKANIIWRPEIEGYVINNQVQTISENGKLDISVSTDSSGHQITIKGTLPVDQHDIIRTAAIQDPKSFARIAFIQALQKNGVNVSTKILISSKESPILKDLQQVAVWTSPPLSEYAKLILKVSHNLGADLIPLLLASHRGKKTFADGMQIIGDFITQDVKLPPNAFVLIDAAGGNENRFTPKAEVQLLTYMHKQNPLQFQRFFDALPILGVDGSLEDFAKKTQATGKVRAKPGTGVAFNLATGSYFLITQALAGYIEAQNGHLLAYMLVVNNATIKTIQDIFSVFEDEGQLSSMIYDQASSKDFVQPL